MQGFTLWHKSMIYNKLRRFKGSQKVHKGSQESVNPLCEPCNMHNTLKFNKLHLSNNELREAYVNP